MSKKIIFTLILVLWVILLFGFIAYKEYTLKTGEKILLKTRPIDPRDLFRGDYIVLTYEISSLNIDILENKDLNVSKGDTVYIGLKKEGKYWTSQNIHKNRPTGLSIRGKIKNIREHISFGKILDIEYGIESFFVPEGEGRELERYRNSQNLDVEVSIDKFGNAVIKNLYIDDKVWIAP